MSVADAAAALSLSPQRVHQLLKSGHLVDVPLAAGRVRHRPGEPRVRLSDVSRLLNFRDSPPTEGLAGEYGPGGTADDYGAARAAALELKIELDEVRDRLKVERTRTEHALQIASDLLEMVRSGLTTEGKIDDVAGAYSKALTQLLAPRHVPTERFTKSD